MQRPRRETQVCQVFGDNTLFGISQPIHLDWVIQLHTLTDPHGIMDSRCILRIQVALQRNCAVILSIITVIHLDNWRSMALPWLRTEEHVSSASVARLVRIEVMEAASGSISVEERGLELSPVVVVVNELVCSIITCTGRGGAPAPNSSSSRCIGLDGYAGVCARGAIGQWCGDRLGIKSARIPITEPPFGSIAHGSFGCLRRLMIARADIVPTPQCHGSATGCLGLPRESEIRFRCITCNRAAVIRIHMIGAICISAQLHCRGHRKAGRHIKELTIAGGEANAFRPALCSH